MAMLNNQMVIINCNELRMFYDWSYIHMIYMYNYSCDWVIYYCNCLTSVSCFVFINFPLSSWGIKSPTSSKLQLTSGTVQM